MRTQFELVFFVHKRKGKIEEDLAKYLSHYSTREYQRERGETSSIFFISIVDSPFTIYPQPN
jgi:hypothetical protein